MLSPHWVVFVNNKVVLALEDSEVARVGRQFEHHPFFPRPRQNRVHPAVFARQAADAGVGVRLG